MASAVVALASLLAFASGRGWRERSRPRNKSQMPALSERDVCQWHEDRNSHQRRVLDLPPSQQMEISDVSSFNTFAAIKIGVNMMNTIE